MNAVSNSDVNLPEENGGGSDTDTNPEESTEYYEPIASGGIEEDDFSDKEEEEEPNGLDVNEEEEEEEEERIREAMERAFREDENRRRAPLTEENSRRVMEAMRGISFGGSAPDWADRLMDQLTIRHLQPHHKLFMPGQPCARDPMDPNRPFLKELPADNINNCYHLLRLESGELQWLIRVFCMECVHRALECTGMYATETRQQQ